MIKIVLSVLIFSIMIISVSADTGDFVDNFNGITLNASLWDEEPRGVAGSVVNISGGIAFMNNTPSTASISIRTNGTFNISEFRYKGNSSTTYRYGTMSIGSGALVGVDGATSWWYTTLYNGYVVQFQQSEMILCIMQDGTKTLLTNTPVNSGTYKNYTLYTNSTGVHVDVDGVLTLTSSNTTFTSGDILLSQGSHASNIRDGYIDWAKGYNVTRDSGVGSVNITYYNVDFDNLTSNCLINISDKTGTLTNISIPWPCNASNEYCLLHPNGTAVQACVTCTGEGDIIWFNGSANRLPEAINYSINETILLDTKFEYYNGTGWQEGESYYYLWFTCFWWTAECANDEQSDSQATLRITNNGSSSGTPKMKLNESAPVGIRIFVDDDNTFAGAIELTDTYQAVSTSLNQDTNVTLWTWAYMYGAPTWEFETYAIVE